MTAEIIVKKPVGKTAPNLADYDSARSTFSWIAARQALDGLPGGAGLNIAHEAVDRHAQGARAEHLALRWMGKGEAVRDFSYRDLGEQTSRFANVLTGLGVQQGERVFVLAGRIPELYITVLGALKRRCVVSPLFSAFGPEPIYTRLTLGSGSVLVTTESLYQKKIAGLRERLPQLKHVLLVGDDGGRTSVTGTLDLAALMREASPRFTIGSTDPEDRALLHFTSGTTGKPKGAAHVHEAVVAHHATGKLALDFHPDGYFWFVGRADDVIKSSGHLIGPFEVESALMEHPAVAEAGVIGKPDPMQFETVKAFVSLKAGYEAGEALRRDLLGFARKRLGAAIAPKEIDFIVNLPKTRSGKIMRRLLKARELGLPEGDTSTLEDAT